MLPARTRRRSLLTGLGGLLAAAAIVPASSASAGEALGAPVAVTGVAVATGGHSAALSGGVYPKGAPASAHFEYGPTTFYGETTPPVAVGAELTTVAAAATVAGLRPGWTYHYRLVATSAGGIATGFDRTFTTWSVVAPAAIAPAPAPAPAFGGVRLVSSRLTVAGGSIAVTLRCPAGAADRCSGRTELTARRRRAATVLLGHARFSVGAGQRATVRVRVARDGARLLRGTGRLTGRDTITARDGDGVTRTTAARVTIRRRAAR